MKKSTKKLIILLCACSFLAAAGVFVALWSTRLSPPKNLAVSDTGILTWDGCKNASLYVVNIDGEEYETDSTQLDIFFITDRYKDYNITVTAKHRLFKGRTRRSDWFVYSLPAPPDDFFQFIKADDGRYIVSVNFSYSGVNEFLDFYPEKLIFPEIDYIAGGVAMCTTNPSENAGKATSALIPTGYERVRLGYLYNLKRVSLSDTVTVIEDKGFYGCENLQEITFPQGLQEIGTQAFYGCESLKRVNMNDGLLRIGSSAFRSCSGLKDIKIPQSVKIIGGRAFYNNSNLSVILPSTVESIGNDAFQGTVYTDAAEIMTGWAFVDPMLFPPSDNTGSVFMAGKLFLNCKLNYDGEDVYVESLTYTDIPDMHQWMPYNSEPVRHGYTFKGWATERDGTVVYTMEQLLSYTGDGWPDDPKADKAPVVPYGTTLYPVWESA